MDRGYRGEVADKVKEDFNIEVEVSHTPNGTKGFTPKPLRWTVERTFKWLDAFRRLIRNYGQTDESAEEMIDLATIKLLIKHIQGLTTLKSKHILRRKPTSASPSAY